MSWRSLCAESARCCCPAPDPMTTTSTGRFHRPCTTSARWCVTPPPQPHRLIAGYLDELDARCSRGRADAHCRGRRVDRRRGGGRNGRWRTRAAWWRCWPRYRRGRASPTRRPAALAARHSAQLLRRDGWRRPPRADACVEPGMAGRRADPVLGRAVAGAARGDGRGGPLRRADAAASWSGWPCRWASCRPSTTPCIPWRSAVEWVAAAPRAALRTVTLDQIGADPAVLGGLPGGPGRRRRAERRGQYG